MGYYTHFSGGIKIKNKKVIKLVRYLINESIAPFDEVEGVIVESNGEIDVSGEGKYYDDEIQKICYFIKYLDKDAEGEISCEGEDSFDIWKISIDKKGVQILKGEIIYEFEKDYSDEDIEEQAKKILNDKQLTKKIILSELGDK